MTGHISAVYTLATLPNGNLVSGSSDFTIKIWDPNDGILAYTFTGNSDTVH